MDKYKLGDIIENPWAGHIDVRVGIYLGENKDTYFVLQNIKGKWEKGSFYKTSTANPKEWKKIGHTDMFKVGQDDLLKIKSNFNIRDDRTIKFEED